MDRDDEAEEIAKPSRRKAALMVFSDMQRVGERIDGKRNFPAPVIC